MVFYEGGSGTSMEDAVVIEGAQDDAEGVRAEYDYIARVFGPGCMRDRQSLTTEGGRWYDIVEIILPSGRRTAMYFDITSYFLGGLRARLADAIGDSETFAGLDEPLERALRAAELRDEPRVPPVVKAAALTAGIVIVGMAIQSAVSKKRRRAA